MADPVVPLPEQHGEIPGNLPAAMEAAGLTRREVDEYHARRMMSESDLVARTAVAAEKRADDGLVERLRELLAAATPGPWKVIQPGQCPIVVSGDRMDDRVVEVCEKMMGGWRKNAKADAALIAEGVSALPALLADNEQLRREKSQWAMERDGLWADRKAAKARAGAAEARADAAEAHIARLAEDVESIYRRVVNTVDPAQSGPNVKRACLDVIRAAASVVSETGEKP